MSAGLIDFHAHFFGCGSDLCVPADPSFLPSGVTAAVDPGSSGTANFELFNATMQLQKVLTALESKKGVITAERTRS